nr:endonuclease domain-containing protein [Sphingomonas sp.]
MRNDPTPAELAVWHRISRFRPAFTRQLVEAPFIIDLACRQARLAVEFDGSQHLDSVEKDARRTAFLQSKGWTVIRLWNSDVLANPDGATLHVLEKAAECLGGTHPNPSLPGRGEKEDRAIAERPLSTRDGTTSGSTALQLDLGLRRGAGIFKPAGTGPSSPLRPCC